ncbi:MAG: acetate--CoA ligase family protein [Alphaproteobacteria bacterium]|nr:acetate--CoA ligase family protein [Alphaproteobacteria bacterium]
MSLDALLNPKSIAILGASDRPSPGRQLMVSAERLGYQGRIYPINPKYPELLGHKCYPGLEALPEPPDVVAFCVNYTRILENFRPMAARGARAAVIFDGGFAERGEEGAKLQSEIVGICRETGIKLNGPNCMGILNPVTRSSVYMQELRDPKGLSGNVGLISQSGSICIGMLTDLRRFGFSHVISSGNEALINTAEYMEALIEDDVTKVIALFTESVREPERFIAALDRAADRGKPVVVLKVGRTERTRHAITSHTGGLAGESRVFSEVLRAHRAIEVDDMDELTEVLAVCQGTRWPTGRRLSLITASGGQAELALDVGSSCGLDLPPLPEASRMEAERVIGPITGDGNPLDAWGNGDYATNMPHAFKVLRETPDLDVIAFCSDSCDDQPMGRPERALDYVKLLADSARQSERPHYLLNTRPGLMNRVQVDFLREQGIVTIGGVRQGLGAVDRIARYLQPRAPLRPAAMQHGAGVLSLLGHSARKTINEYDAKRLLAQHGIPVTREELVRGLDEARAAARTIGYPVVMKVASDEIAHKSEHGLVIVGIADEAALDAAWRLIDGRLAAMPGGRPAIAGIVVQQMVKGGIEVFAGVSRDPDFGPVLAFGLGGIAIEVMRDFALRMLPLRQGDAEAMIGEIRGAAMLRGIRGAPPADVESLARCLYALADFAHADRANIVEMDLNPIMVLPQGRGCVVVDALIVPAKSAKG